MTQLIQEIARLSAENQELYRSIQERFSQQPPTQPATKPQPWSVPVLQPLPKPLKCPPLELFNGRSPTTVKSWLNVVKARLITQQRDIDSPTTITWISTHFTDRAETWWSSRQQVTNDLPVLALRHLIHFVQLLFTDPDPRNTVDRRLSILKQTGTVATYAHQFRALQLQIPDRSEQDWINLFLKGLRPIVLKLVALHAQTWYCGQDN